MASLQTRRFILKQSMALGNEGGPLFSRFLNGNETGTINAQLEGYITMYKPAVGNRSTADVDAKRRHNMKALGKKIENMFVAITFAEAGEFETAREYCTG